MSNLDAILKNLNTDDLISFLHLIDKYSLVNLTIKTIDKVVIDYLGSVNNTNHIDYLYDLCKRYQLRFMYIYLHNLSC